MYVSYIKKLTNYLSLRNKDINILNFIVKLNPNQFKQSDSKKLRRKPQRIQQWKLEIDCTRQKAGYKTDKARRKNKTK